MRGHSRERARSPGGTQALWGARAAALAGAAILAVGCARLPAAASGAEARARLLAAHARPPAPTRGVGEVRARVRDDRGSFEARWGSAGDSLVVIGYAGPVRALDAALLGDSVYVAVRPRDLGVAGVVRGGRGLGADAVRFLLRPWDFSIPWMHEALARASVEPRDDGWRLRARGVTEGGELSVVLDLDARAEPRALTLVREGDPALAAELRYGAWRGYAAGRYPRWIEWKRRDAEIRLDLRDVDPLPDGALRTLPPPREEWRVVSLDDPEGRRLLGRLLGTQDDEEEDSR